MTWMAIQLARDVADGKDALNNDITQRAAFCDVRAIPSAWTAQDAQLYGRDAVSEGAKFILCAPYETVRRAQYLLLGEKTWRITQVQWFGTKCVVAGVLYAD